MIFIIIWHFLFHGLSHILYNSNPNIPILSTPGIVNFFGTKFLSYISAVEINCYVLISGYFLIKSEFRFNRIIKIWGETFFYSFFICILIYFFGSTTIEIKEIIKSAFPIKYNIYWFVTNYIALVVLAPFLSRLIFSLKKRDFQILIIILSILNLDLFKGIPYGNIFSGSQSLFWFIYLFFIASYIRLYEPLKHVKYFGLYFISLCLLLTVLFAINIYIHYEFLGQKTVYNFIINYNGITFFSSVFLFMCIKHHSFPSNKFIHFITRIAPYTFGIYLIYDNPYIRELIWEHWVNSMKYVNSYFLLPLLLFVSISIFCICALLDYSRSKLVDILHINKLPSFIINKLGNHKWVICIKDFRKSKNV